MKRNCNGCKCLAIDYVHGYKCELGYPVKVENYKYSPDTEIKCPKPRTYRQYLDVMKDFIVYRYRKSGQHIK